ncbi:TAXI family TRAP transporter solute-binding subunit [Desulfobaculum bizertense]|uniref:TRAP transporter solute receptor, TAXI family n=1 Tax=Desulfobaculum bizertense DSM 18034 TaxID=1121442 RepID=A0A1T4W920_9BACT|nr:TAXI family TRAP transporter solute-binding subunit [Desulfobaculum bizertense]UIJ39235.1 TAXI family TRAP transporter solute-binding subunit [Desulfobaculum bizertense]SKA73763.1 hypothetical protein SAMN02745702_01913 [Desulfobaculum bizertense DSM 18034]
MRKWFMLACAFALAFVVTGVQAPEAQAKTQFVTIGTGGLTGVYYPTGGAIARMVNRKRAEYGIRCTVESTGGSIFNANAISSGDLEFGIVQSDLQYLAINGKGDWAKRGPQKKLRAVFALHPETVTIVAADDANINGPEDLKGKTVNIGNPGSGQRTNAMDLFDILGITLDDLNAQGVKPAEAPSLLQDGRIDAFFYTVGHPSGAIKEATAGKRKVHIVPVTGIDELYKKYPYYAPSVVPKAFYPNSSNTEDVKGFGVKATLMTSSDVSDDVVYAITKEVFENFEEFKKLHPAYQVMTKEGMLQGLTAPIHPGALKYYKEAGLMK